MEGHEKVRFFKTACQACHCECGVIVEVRDGRVVHIEGDPDHPENQGIMCPKGLSYIDLLYHPDRLKYPLKRTGKRGEGQFERIGWDEALDIVAKEFNKIREKHGPEAIGFAWNDGPRTYCVPYTALLYAMGSANSLLVAHICHMPSYIADSLSFGKMVSSEVGPDYLNSRCIMIWGCNPPATHPSKAKQIFEGMAKGAKLIVVDPIFTPLASKADLWLQIRPATDDALALGMLHVIINENLYDRDFVEKWCNGFEPLRKRVQDYPPQRVSKITWIPEEEIIQAARMYATLKPSSFHHRTALEMHTNTFQTLRALAILMAITGNIDVKGGNVINSLPKGYKSYFELMTGYDFRPPAEVENKRIGVKEFPVLCGAESFRPFSHLPTAIKSMITGKPYPIKGVFGAVNWITACENAKEAYEAIMNLDFLMISDFFMTPTAELADIVLPAATWLENDDYCDISYLNFFSLRQKVIEPVGECWDEKKIALEIAKRMGILEKYAIRASSVEEFNDFRVKGMGKTFDEMKEIMYVKEPFNYKKYEQGGFDTPTAKVDLYSTVLAKHGYDPLPYYEENPETPLSTPELAKKYPLLLITAGKHIAFYHSANRQIRWLRELNPEPTIDIHPETAEKRGIQDGDWVWIETSKKTQGRVKQKARLTLAVHPQVVHAEAHWWFPERQGELRRQGFWESNINVITPSDPPYDPIVGSTPLNGLLCKVYKVEED